MTHEERIQNKMETMKDEFEARKMMGEMINNAPGKMDNLIMGLIIAGNLGDKIFKNDVEIMYRCKFQIQEVLRKMEKGKVELENLLVELDQKIGGMK